ncbi:hypothetical protein Taro_051663 [Colocasia esculenta]|uniref:Uncharacterized protein n=1 Tax=Colocasia esculenta TaxID=4460 RepID=A0A843XGN8_COLES|nr:hypothetical protein [Colocasia esculenta]
MYNSNTGVRVSRSDDTDLDGTTQVPRQSPELTAWLTKNLGHPTGECTLGLELLLSPTGQSHRGGPHSGAVGQEVATPGCLGAVCRLWDADQPWVVSGQGLFRRDIWVHCLNEIEPLRLRLAAPTLGLHQRWTDEAEPKGIGRKTRGKAKTMDWRTRFPEQFSDWHRGGQVVTSDATDSTAYLQRYQEEYGLRDFMRPERDGRDTLIGQLEGQLAATTAQLAEARAALETLRTAQGTAVQTEMGGASSSRGLAVAAEVSSLQEQLAAAVARAERAERDLAIRSEELESALARETLTIAKLTKQGSQPMPTELPRDVAELRALLALERRDLERQQGQ